MRQINTSSFFCGTIGTSHWPSFTARCCCAFFSIPPGLSLDSLTESRTSAAYRYHFESRRFGSSGDPFCWPIALFLGLLTFRTLGTSLWWSRARCFGFRGVFSWSWVWLTEYSGTCSSAPHCGPIETENFSTHTPRDFPWVWAAPKTWFDRLSYSFTLTTRGPSGRGRSQSWIV